MAQKIALALSGGGAKGLAHIGVIEVLEENGFEITSVSGTSAGALIGGIYAAGKLNEFKEWVLKLRKRDVFNYLDFSLGKGGLIKGEKAFAALKKFIPDQNIENLKVPFTAVAVDILKEEEIHFTEGSLYAAMRASVSIPDIFVPVQSNERLLVDGGVLNPLPLDCIKRTDGDLLFAVNLYDKNKLKNGLENLRKAQMETRKLPKQVLKLRRRLFKSIKKKGKVSVGYLKLLELTTDAMTHQIADLSLKLHKPDLLVSIPADIAGIFEFHRAEYLINYGRKKTLETLENFRSNSQT